MVRYARHLPERGGLELPKVYEKTLMSIGLLKAPLNHRA